MQGVLPFYRQLEVTAQGRHCHASGRQVELGIGRPDPAREEAAAGSHRQAWAGPISRVYCPGPVVEAMTQPIPVHIGPSLHVIADASEGLHERYELGCSNCLMALEFVFDYLESQEST